MFKSLFISILFSGLIGAAVYHIFYCHPVTYVKLIAEDSWGEYGTFLCYLMSFFLIAGAMRHSRDLRKPGYLALALCCFIMAMEEVSWLQRIIGIGTPEGLAAINNQSELNFHNIQYVKYTKIVFSYLVSFWALVLPYLNYRFGGIKRLVRKIGVPVLPVRMIPLFILALFFFIAMPIPKYDEINELIFGIGFAWYALDLFIRASRDSEKFHLIQKAAPVLLALIIIAGSGFLSCRWPYVSDLQWRYNQFAANVYLRDRMYEQCGELYRYIFDNPWLINDTSQYYYGVYLDKIGEKQKARNVFALALTEQEKLCEHKRNEPADHVMMAQIYAGLNESAKSLDQYNRAVELYREKLNKSKSPMKRCKLYLAIGDIYYTSNQYYKAEENYRMAIIEASSKKEREKIIRHLQDLIALSVRDAHLSEQI